MWLSIGVWLFYYIAEKDSGFSSIMQLGLDKGIIWERKRERERETEE